MFEVDAGWDGLVRATAAEARRFVEQVPPEHDVRLNFALLSAEERDSG
jgi:hypothetical protein